MAKSLANFLISFIDLIYSSKPDWIVLAGDRGEQLMASIGAGFCYIPTCHTNRRTKWKYRWYVSIMKNADFKIKKGTKRIYLYI